MSKPTYDNVRPLVVRADVQANALLVSFQCPATKVIVESRGNLRPDNSMQGVMVRSVERNVMWALRNAVYSAVRSLLGYSIAGRLVQDVTSQAFNDATRNSKILTEAQKQAATVDAFTSVARQFRWDAGASRWISVQVGTAADTPYDALLRSAPVVVPYDRNVLARMLVAVASADGRLQPEEQELLLEFLGGDLPPLAEIQRLPPVSVVELGETSPGPVREAMLLVAWSLTLADRGMDATEKGLLDGYAVALGVRPERNAQLLQMAQEHLVESYVATAASVGQAPHAIRASARELATYVGMKADDAERVAIRYGKRQGWA
jgi:hypothetical protein